MPAIPLLAWVPDADPTTPGVIAEVTNLLPTSRGYAPDFGLEAAANTTATLSGQCLGGSVVRPGTSSPVLMLATEDALYSYFGTLRDVTRASPYNVATPGSTWKFESFGTDVFALQANNELQRTVDPYIGIAMTNVTGAPTGFTMAVQSNFLMIGNTFSAVGASWPYVDGWWCSALGDATNWTPDVATQCARGRLTQTPGGIIRMIAYQDNILAFKDSSVLRGTYIGTPTIWQWSVISTDIGIAGHDAAVQADGILYWLGPRGFYRFNGGGIQRIQSAPWEWFRNDSGGYLLRALTKAVFDPVRRVVRWHYARSTTINNTVPGCIVYHVDTDRWGWTTSASEWAMTLPVEFVPSVTSATTLQLSDVAAVVDSATHTVMAYTDTPANSQFATGDIGDDNAVSMLRQARARFLEAPVNAFCQHSYRMNLWDTPTVGFEMAMQDGKFDFSQSARWHRLRFEGTGMYEMNAFTVDAAAAGKR